MERINYVEGDVVVGLEGPRKGQLFTVTGFLVDEGLCPVCGVVQLGVFFAEKPPLRHDDAWCPYHFRKAFTPDVEVAREILEPVTKKTVRLEPLRWPIPEHWTVKP